MGEQPLAFTRSFLVKFPFRSELSLTLPSRGSFRAYSKVIVTLAESIRTMFRGLV